MGMLYVRDKSSKKRKPTKAQRELAEQWEAMLKKYATKPVSVRHEPLKAPKAYVRETAYHPSLNSGHHDTAAKPAKVYTGTKMLGIGTMHKSNSVPIFSNEEAVEIATMRRG
jgi:hypothetical protein